MAKRSRRGEKHRVSEKMRAASRRNLEKAWAANRAHYEFTPARRANSLRTIQLAVAAIRGKKRQPSEAQRRSSRETIRKALEALQTRGRTPEHLAKLRESIVKARAARTKHSDMLHAQAITEHGMYAKNLVATIARLDEDPKDFVEFLVSARDFLNPNSAEENRTAVLIAEALWRHHRLYYAQARWEIEEIRKTLGRWPAKGEESGNRMRRKFYLLLYALAGGERYQEREKILRRAVARLLQRFLRLRLGEPDADLLVPVPPLRRRGMRELMLEKLGKALANIENRAEN